MKGPYEHYTPSSVDKFDRVLLLGGFAFFALFMYFIWAIYADMYNRAMVECMKTHSQDVCVEVLK